MELLHQYGYSLVFSVVLLEQLGLPIPAAPLMILSGAIAAGGELKLSWIIVFATLAAFIGDFVWYLIGRRKGRRVLSLLCRLSLSPDSCVKKTENSFLRYGMNSLLFAKFVPGLNTIAPPMAGMFNANFFAFLWRDLAGAVIYFLVFALPGFFFEKIVFDVTNIIEQIGRTFFWILIAGFGAYVLAKYVRLKILQKVLFHARITPKELHERMTAGEDLIIVDLRASALKGDAEETLPGAIKIAPDQLDQHLHRLDKDKWIIMYCT